MTINSKFGCLNKLYLIAYLIIYIIYYTFCIECNESNNPSRSQVQVQTNYIVLKGYVEFFPSLAEIIRFYIYEN